MIQTNTHTTSSSSTFRVDTGEVSKVVPFPNLDMVKSQSLTYINHLVLRLQASLQELQARNVTAERLESMAILIHDSMSTNNRNYHSVQHVFEISKDESDPIALLATYFHDTIYYQVDGTLTPKQANILEGTFQVDRSTGTHTFYASKSDNDSSADPLLKMIEGLFGYTPGQEITASDGLNEFLSAVIATRELEPHLTKEELLQVACCIESTIPFRAEDPETGRGHLDQLYENMKQMRDEYSLVLSDDDLVTSIQRAAIMSNNDVGNFGTLDRKFFLDKTWSLLDEGNKSLRQNYSYTVQEFQHALFKLYSFFNFLIPSLVFKSFRGIPLQEELDEKTKQCQTNLRIGRSYVGAKLLAISVVAALAELTGGDAPITLFMGECPSRNHVSGHVEDFLPALPSGACVEDCDPDVFDILANGRTMDSSFDPKESPLAAYLYGQLGDANVHKIIQENQIYPLEQSNSLSLLASLPQEAMEVVGESVIPLAPTRADRIRGVIQELPSIRKAARLRDTPIE